MTDGGGTIQQRHRLRQPRRRRTCGRPLSAEGSRGRAGAGRRAWRRLGAGVRTAFQYWGPYLAARGIAMFSICYRLATKAKTFPEAVQDILAGVQFVRGKAATSASIRRASGLWAHLRRRPPRGARRAFRQKIHRRLSAGRLRVRRSGRQGSGRRLWHLRCRGDVDELSGPGRPREQYPEIHRAHRRWRTGRLYFDASPISYATFANNAIGVLLVTGTEDDLVDRKVQTDPFQLALKQAGFFVRPCIVPGAPHYWMNDPIDEPGSSPAFSRRACCAFLPSDCKAAWSMIRKSGSRFSEKIMLQRKTRP